MLKKPARVRTWTDVKRQLKEHLDADTRSNFVIFLDAGLTKDAYYKTFDKYRSGSKMREVTVYKLAESLNIAVTYIDDFPYFGNVLIKSKSGESIAELTRRAIDRAGDIEILSQMSEILILELSSIVSQSSKRTALSVDQFHRILKTTQLEVTADSDNTIVVLDGKEEVSRIEPVVFSSSQARVYHGISSKGEMYDSGLLELVDPENRAKHSITQEEIRELTLIQNSRNSDGTVDQWINVLYAIRGLNHPATPSSE
jgi:hypothetical protein